MSTSQTLPADTPLPSASAADHSYKPVAGTLHTIALLAFLGAWTYMGVLQTNQMRAQSAPSHWLLYLPTMAMEWSVFAYIAWGLRRRGVSLRELIGPRWSNAAQVFTDLGIAIAFQICALAVLTGVARVLHSNPDPKNVMFMMPNGVIEIVFWVLLSVTAGICEETIFRGYFQRQFAGWTGSTAVGILISAVLFGTVHLYQGGKQTIIIGSLGAMLGALAAYRRSLKPGMIGHSLQDGITGVVLSLTRR